MHRLAAEAILAAEAARIFSPDRKQSIARVLVNFADKLARRPDPNELDALPADFGGLSAVMPIYAGVFMVITLSSIGLPTLNGFIGEFTILVGAFNRVWWWALVGAFGSAKFCPFGPMYFKSCNPQLKWMTSHLPSPSQASI